MAMIDGKKILPIALIATVLLTGACLMPFSDDVARRVDKDLTFAQVVASPESYIGRTILLGGTIIESNPTKEGGTEIIVLEQPLTFDYSPAPGDRTRGRFIIRTQDFLDPAVYSKGRKITAVAVVRGHEMRPIGEKNYDYPMLEAVEIKLWPLPLAAPGILFIDPIYGPYSDPMPHHAPYPWYPGQRKPR